MWSAVLLTHERKHLHMGVGWEALLTAVKDFKCSADEDAGDRIEVAWVISQAPTPGDVQYWHWHSGNDVPAALPDWKELP